MRLPERLLSEPGKTKEGKGVWIEKEKAWDSLDSSGKGWGRHYDQPAAYGVFSRHRGQELGLLSGEEAASTAGSRLFCSCLLWACGSQLLTGVGVML